MGDETLPTRLERDTLGEMEVPGGSLYGAHTARAVANFRISSWPLPTGLLRALAVIKAAFARANGERGVLPADLAEAVAEAAEEVAAGRHLQQFPVDVFQTGSGTSTNMNMNEVVAHLANRRLGGDPTANRPVHPNDHVNRGQSSNDVIPAALRVASLAAWREEIRPTATGVLTELHRLAEAHRRTVTLARTHLMDGVPTTYGRVFGAWAARLEEAVVRCDATVAVLSALPLGGTAVGSGIDADPEAVKRAVSLLAEATGLTLELSATPAAGIQAQDEPIAHADALDGLARVLLAVANDLRLRSSGPAGGLGDLRLPAVQPGSSIMPGKINPVIPEAVVLAAIQVGGLAAACRATASLHQLDLSHATPLLAWNLDTMGRLVAGACRTLGERCLRGIEVDIQHCRALAERSPALATALAARIGYDEAARVAKSAESAGETVVVAARRLGVIPDAELDVILDLDRLAGVENEP